MDQDLIKLSHRETFLLSLQRQEIVLESDPWLRGKKLDSRFHSLKIFQVLLALIPLILFCIIVIRSTTTEISISYFLQIFTPYELVNPKNTISIIKRWKLRYDFLPTSEYLPLRKLLVDRDCKPIIWQNINDQDFLASTVHVVLSLILFKHVVVCRR